MTLHQQATVVDALQINNWSRPVLEELCNGGVSAVNATCAVWETAAETFRSVAVWLELVRQNADLAFLATTAADIDTAKRDGRIAVFLGFQNTSPFEDDYRYVEAFHRLGVRIAQLTYNNQNLVGGGCFEPEDSGLTRYGRVVVAEMNRVGMVIDLSHVGYRTCRDAIDGSQQPVALTHSNPLWFHPTPRNKPDDVIAALVERGGMIGCCIYPTVSGGEDVSIAEFGTMVRRMVDTYGPDHIGIGTDCTRGWDQHFVGWLRNGRWNPTDPADAPTWPNWPHWFSGPLDFPRLTDGLLGAGLDEQTVTAVLGANWARFFQTVMTPMEELTHV